MADANVLTPFKIKSIKIGQLDHAFYRDLELAQEVEILKETKDLSDHIGYKLKLKFITHD